MYNFRELMPVFNYSLDCLRAVISFVLHIAALGVFFPYLVTLPMNEAFNISLLLYCLFLFVLWDLTLRCGSAAYGLFTSNPKQSDFTAGVKNA